MGGRRPSDPDSPDAVTKAVCSDAPVTNRDLFWILLLDYLTYAAMCWRDYAAQPYQKTIWHYLMFNIGPHFFVYYIPHNKRHWYLVGRLLYCVQLLTLTVNLWVIGLDGEDPRVSAMRCGIIILRFMHSAACIRRHGPTGDNWVALPRYMVQVWGQRDTWASRLFFWWIFLGLLTVLGANVVFNAHWNYGELGVDDPLIATQASNCFTSSGFNFFLMNVMLNDPRKQCIMLTVNALLFWVQWPMMFEMFTNNRIPYFHLLSEFLFSCDAVAMFVTWRRDVRQEAEEMLRPAATLPAEECSGRHDTGPEDVGVWH